MVDGDVFCMNEAADAAESAAALFARKQTNKGRAAERACQERCYANAAQQDAADATAAEQGVRVVAVEELAKTAAAAAQRSAADAASDDDKEAAVFANRRGD